jgi:hypothetical protein
MFRAYNQTQFQGYNLLHMKQLFDVPGIHNLLLMDQYLITHEDLFVAREATQPNTRRRTIHPSLRTAAAPETGRPNEARLPAA